MTPDQIAAEMSRSFKGASQFWTGWTTAWFDGLARTGNVFASMFMPRY